VGIAASVRSKLLGISAYQRPPSTPLTLETPQLERLRRELFGGALTGPLTSKTRWYIGEIEEAERAADGGDMLRVGQLMHAARRDGVFSGVLSTRTGGLVRLPKRFRGDRDVVEALEPGHDSVRSVFDEMNPPQELALLAGDGLLCGIGVAEYVPVEGRDFPVLVRQDPRSLYFRFTENTWYFRSVFGDIPITPGDGRWVLHTPGGRVQPWAYALWRCIGQAYVRKSQAQLHKDIWEAKLAHPARIAEHPQAASDEQSQAWFRKVMAWGVNTVFATPPGYTVRLLESNGRGYESFCKTIAEQDNEFVIAIAGQTVTTDGGAGFQNSDIHKTIRADLIKETADALAYTVNTQCIPVFVAKRFGEAAIDTKPCTMLWDVTPPKDRNSEATSLTAAATAVTKLDEALRPHAMQLDVDAVCEQFAIPLLRPEIAAAGAAAQLGPDGKPMLRLLQGGGGTGGAATGGSTDGDVLAPVDTQPGNDAAQDTALNGAQVASLLQVIQAVANGQLPRDAGIAIIKRAFNVDDAGATELMGSVGAGFVPAAAAPAAAAPPKPKPDEAAA
jgi:phage gp29-like protein